MLNLLKLVRAGLGHAGYVLWKRDFMAFGIDPWIDVRRLDRAWKRSTSVIFDVGANAGQTIVKISASFPEARIWAFEPHPTTFARLTSAIQGNSNVSTHQLALGETNGNVMLFDYGDHNSLINSLVPDARYPKRNGFNSQVLMVDGVTLDTFCLEQGVKRIDILKIDVEGSELSVLEGATGMLSDRRVRYIYLEFNELQPKPDATGGALIPISNFLTKFGLRYVATYTDYVLAEGEFFVCANALFALPPQAELT